MISCSICGQKMEYDEGVGNFADGYSCFECLEELEKLTDKLTKKQEDFILEQAREKVEDLDKNE